MAIDSVSRGGAPGALAPLPMTARQSSMQAPQDATDIATQASKQGAVAVAPAGSADTRAAFDTSRSARPEQKDVEDAVEKVQKVVAAQANNLLFSIDEESGRTVVKVVDSTTKETIRQIPSEEILSIAKALDKLQGLLLKQTA